MSTFTFVKIAECFLHAYFRILLFKMVYLSLFLQLKVQTKISSYVFLYIFTFVKINFHHFSKLLLSKKRPYLELYSGPHFPAFGLNTERYSVFLRIQSKCGKTDQNNSKYGHIHAVFRIENFFSTGSLKLGKK